MENIKRILNAFNNKPENKVYYITSNIGITENAMPKENEEFINCDTMDEKNNEIYKIYLSGKKVVLTGIHSSFALISYIKTIKLKVKTEDLIFYLCTKYPGFYLNNEELKNYLN